VRVARRAWWTMIVLLTVAAVAAGVIAIWQLSAGGADQNSSTAISSTRTSPVAMNPADDADARAAILGEVKADAPKLLTYTPENVEASLTAAAALTTGSFKDWYSKFIHDQVIPSAQQKKITQTAEVLAAGVVSLTDQKAVLLVYVNKTTTEADQPPKRQATTIRVGMRKDSGDWRIEAFDPL
jgi:Mce-associated membrane protein